MLAQQVLLVGGGIDRSSRCQTGTLFCRDLNLDLFGNCARDLTLQLQDVGQVALVFTRPQMRIRRHVNQLHADAHAIAGAQHRPFDDRVHVQRLRNLRKRAGATFEPHHRRARDDAQRADTGKVADERFCHAVGEVFLRRVA